MESSQLLRTGLAALKQKDYAAAIVHLEEVEQTHSVALREKAQAGLVKAYALTGRVPEAIALCQRLSTSATPQAKSWASQTLGDLTRRYPAAVSAVSSTPDAVDATGFMPLSSSASNLTSFVPLPASAMQNDRPIVESIPSPAVSVPPASRSAPDLTNDSAAQPSIGSSSDHAADIPDSTAELSAQPSATAASFPDLNWKQAARAQKWGSLGAIDRSTLWAVTLGTAIALIWLIRTLPLMLQDSLYWICFQIAVLTPFKQIVLWVSPAKEPGIGIPIGLLILFVVSPWLLDRLLRQFHQLQPLTLSRLEFYSPEAGRLLKRVCNQRRQRLPQLGILPTAAPVSLTYGYLPRNARIVVSQGLLDRLEDAEIAALYATELGHVINWDFGVLSWLTLVVQIPYLLYWQASAWGDRQHDRVLQTVAVLVSSASYGLYWVFRLPGLWLSRLRLYYGDRVAAELTGNPNALTRALLKIAIGTAQTLQRWEHTSYLLEGFELLAPVGYRSALTLGSLYCSNTAVLEWDYRNPHRRWLSLLNAHPPLGDRLFLLTQYAQQWRLISELDWQQGTPQAPSSSLRATVAPLLRRKFLLQAAPFVGMLAGLAVTLGLWLLDWLADRFNWLGLLWLWGDRSLLIGSLLIGFSLGMFIRINAYYPDIKRVNLLIEPPLPDLLISETSLPVHSQPVRLQGKLLGRRGFANWLHQDLILQTQSGLIRLHHTSRWGLLSNLLPRSPRPSALMQQPVTVTGWFRRGATPWLDLDTLQARGTLLKSDHPLWSTLLASAAALIGVLIILRGEA